MTTRAAIYQRARMSRDARFDGKFYIAVKTTKVYCRPICRVRPPLEKNVTYFDNAVEAAQAGYRPCLKCRPDSAPGSPTWQGTNTTLQRAVKLVQQGALQQQNLQQLSDKLGITDRYLRKLFEESYGVSPKTFALYQQCLFAKQLLHETNLSVTDIALASGFNSIRRFNDCFKQQMKLTPTEVRKANSKQSQTPSLSLNLSYRPPFNWSFMQSFYAHRVISGLEWVDGNSYGRTFRTHDSKGYFEVTPKPDENQIAVKISMDDTKELQWVTQNIRRVFDLDCDSIQIDKLLAKQLNGATRIESGLRIPGIWDPFEAGIRAILGQQISVSAALKLVTQLVQELGESLNSDENQIAHATPNPQLKLFPTPEVVMNSNLEFFRMPGKRKESLRAFAAHINEHGYNNIDSILEIKGIGRWTLDYIKLRGLSETDIFLAGDLGIQKAMKKYGEGFDVESFSPWKSYLTFQLWNL